MSKIRFRVTTMADGKEFYQLQMKESFLKPWVNLLKRGMSSDQAMRDCHYEFGTKEFAEVWKDVWIKQEAERNAQRDAAKVKSVKYIPIDYP